MLEVGARYRAGLPAQLVVVVVVGGGGGAIPHVVGVVVVDGAHLTNYAPSC